MVDEVIDIFFGWIWAVFPKSYVHENIKSSWTYATGIYKLCINKNEKNSLHIAVSTVCKGTMEHIGNLHFKISIF